jgi:hypothetical protein
MSANGRGRSVAVALGWSPPQLLGLAERGCESAEIKELTNCSKRCIRASTCCLASVRSPATRLRSLACGAKMHVVLRAMQLLHGTLRSHLSLVFEVSDFGAASMLVRRSHFRWRHSEHDSRARPALMLIRTEALDLRYT